MKQLTVAILGYGEGGRYLAGALISQTGINVIAYDVAMADPAVATKIQHAARKAGIGTRDAIGNWLSEVDMAFSLVPGSAASEISKAVATRMRPGAIYCDLNSITGDRMRDVARSFESTQVRVIDGSVLGNFSGGNKVPVLLVGEGADEVKSILPASKFVVDVVRGKIGDASAIKMLRSILMKGLEALFIECLVAADRQGVREALLAAFKDVDERPFAKTIEIMTTTHLVHAERRMKEIDSVLSVLDSEHVWNVMTVAARKVYQNTVDAGVRPADGDIRPLDETLTILGAIYNSRSAN